VQPNVIDIKLGTVLFDEDASPEKRARMERAARDTTIGATGLRLTGFQVTRVHRILFLGGAHHISDIRSQNWEIGPHGQGLWQIPHT
jgi:hypothetical protein